MVGVVLVAGACSTYAPVTTSITPSSGTVRLSLNDAGRSEMLGPLGSEVTSVPLEQVAGKLKLVPLDHPLIRAARRVGTNFGD